MSKFTNDMLQEQNWTLNCEKKGELAILALHQGTSWWADDAQHTMGYQTLCEMHDRQDVITYIFH
jgi:hypothetical protein